MGTKQDGDPCLDAALDDEPLFILLGRDTFAPALVRLWAAQRRLEVRAGSRPVSDLDQIERAERTAERMEDWRRDADEAWRTQPELPLAAPGSSWAELEGQWDLTRPFDPTIYRKGDVDGTLYTPQPVADKDGWIDWAGGECPVPKGTWVIPRFRSAVLGDEPQPAASLRWDHWGASADIVAYRVVPK